MRLEDIADVVLGAEDYDTEVRFSGQTAVFMGIWPLPNANSLDVIKRVRAEMDGDPERAAHRAAGAHRLRRHRVHQQRHPRGGAAPCGETLLIVVIVIFLFLGSLRSVLVPLVAIPVSLIGAVFLMQVFGFTINLLTLLAIVLSVGLVVDDAIVVVENVERHLREGQSPHGGRAPGRARAGRPDHRHDDHAGGGLCADRPAGRPDRLAVPRVRLHAGRRGRHLRRRRADALAGDVLAAADRGHDEHGLHGPDQPRLRPLQRVLRPRARRHAARPPGRLPRLDRRRACWRSRCS